MKKVFLVAASLHMSSKTIQLYAVYVSIEEAKACQKVARPKTSFIVHQHVEFVIMEAVLSSKEYYVPDYLSGLAGALLFLSDNLSPILFQYYKFLISIAKQSYL